jgi:hypothetical protein
LIILWGHFLVINRRGNRVKAVYCKPNYSCVEAKDPKALASRWWKRQLSELWRKIKKGKKFKIKKNANSNPF